MCALRGGTVCRARVTTLYWHTIMMHKRAVVIDARLPRTNRFMFFAPFMRCLALSICFLPVSTLAVQESNSERGVFLWSFM